MKIQVECPPHTPIVVPEGNFFFDSLAAAFPDGEKKTKIGITPFAKACALHSLYEFDSTDQRLYNKIVGVIDTLPEDHLLDAELLD